MFDVALMYDNQETQHRVVVGKEYYEPQALEPEMPVEAALGLILQQKLPRTRTPGAMLSSAQFPTAYFAVGGVEQWYGEDFLAILDDMSGLRLREEGKEGAYWRFNRVNGASGGWGALCDGGKLCVVARARGGGRPHRRTGLLTNPSRPCISPQITTQHAWRIPGTFLLRWVCCDRWLDSSLSRSGSLGGCVGVCFQGLLAESRLPISSSCIASGSVHQPARTPCKPVVCPCGVEANRPGGV